MKFHTRKFAAALLLSAVPFTALSCKEEKPAPPAADPAPSPGGSSVSKSAAGSVEVSSSAWGFAAQLPKSTEGFVSFYRLSDLWDGFMGSNFLKRIEANPQFQLGGVRAQLESDPQFKEVAGLLREIAGKEAVFAFSDGFTDNAGKIAKAVMPVMQAIFMAGAQQGMKRVAEGNAAPTAEAPENPLAKLSPEVRSKLITDLLEADFPPVVAAVKAGSVRAKLDAMLKQALSAIPPEAPVETGSYKLDGTHEFQSLTFKVAKLNVSSDAASAEMRELTEMMGDAAKAKAAIEKMKTKTLEASWGWVGDYLVISLGKDHSHLKLASLADSVLSLPEVASRAGAWQEKKPFMLSYDSQEMIRAFSGMFGGMMSTLVSIAESGAGRAPFPLDPLIADLKKLEARANEIWPNDADAAVAAAWWDGGLHIEGFGGSKPRAFDSSKPLTYGSLAGPTTVFLSESRVNEAESDKTFAFIEEASSTLYASFQKNILPSLPDEQKSSITMGAGFAVGMIQALWKNFGDFRASLGGESAVLVNLDGAMPPLPQVPTELKDMKIPRVIMVSDLKDRTKLASAWKGVGDVLGGVIAMAKLPIKPTPTEKKDGAVTMWGWDLPMDLGDIWPHTAVAGDRWYAGTSPSFTKETAAKSPTASGPPSGAHVRINFDAVWNFASSVVPLAPAPPEQKQMITDVLQLLRVLGELDARTGESNGASHHHVHIRITDVK